MRRLYIIFGLLVVAMAVHAIDRSKLATYASSLQGKKKEALKTEVFNIIRLSTPPPISYSGLWDAYKTTDKRSDGYLRDWYSDKTDYVIGGNKQGASYKKEGDSYNREHLVPQSWFSEDSPMKSDIVHVVPTDGWVNNKRGNNYLAEVKKPDNPSKPYDGYWSNNYCYYGKCMTSGYSGTVFEPNDEIKGDIARIYFYMATCYQDRITKWSGGLFTGTTYQPYAEWYFTMLKRWAKNDPIDAVEIARNNAVYSKQTNRNLFVDFPNLAEYIWGDSTNVAFNPYTSITTASDDDRYYNGGGSQGGGEEDEVTPPVFSPAGGTYIAEVTVTLSAASGLTILYTTDGTSPVDNGTVYEAPILVNENMTIKAVAVDGEGNMSDVVTATYVISAASEDIFIETFDLCDGTGGNSGGFSGSVANSSDNFKPDNKGWTASSYFGGDKCARFGSSSKPGVVTTPTFNINGETTLSFRAVPWGTDGTTLTLSVDGNATLSETNLTMKAGEWTTYTVTLEGSGPVTVTFTPVKRFFLDEVNVKAVVTSVPGDVNRDGRVNVADIMLVVNMVLENIPKDPVTYDMDAADVNGDGDIKVTDVMGIVNIALGN